jgi:hypothetical protein
VSNALQSNEFTTEADLHATHTETSGLELDLEVYSKALNHDSAAANTKLSLNSINQHGKRALAHTESTHIEPAAVIQVPSQQHDLQDAAAFDQEDGVNRAEDATGVPYIIALCITL